MTTITHKRIHEEVKTRYARIADEFKIDVSAYDTITDTAASNGCCSADNGCGGGDDNQIDALFKNLYTTDFTFIMYGG